MLKRIGPYFIFGMLLVLLAFGFMIFLYIAAIGFAVGLILFAIDWIKRAWKGESPNEKPRTHKRVIRIIDLKDWKKH